MKIKLILLVLLMPAVFFATCKKYDPWFSGPFMADGANNTAKGHINPDIYLYYVINNASYDNDWKKTSVSKTKSFVPELSISFGISSWMDITFDGQAITSEYMDTHATEWRDSSIKLGFQLLKEKEGTAIPSLRFILKEYLPTGKYQHLKRSLIDGTGTGAYTTTMGLNAGKTLKLFNCHWLKLVTNFSYSIPTKVSVDSINVYTGSLPAYGKVSPGKTYTAYFSFDFSFTQRFAFSMDFSYQYITRTRFKGIRVIATTPIQPIVDPVIVRAISDIPPTLLISQVNSRSALFTISPALEYNFTENLGVIVTYWTSIAGKNIPAFKSVVGSLSYTF